MGVSSNGKNANKPNNYTLFSSGDKIRIRILKIA